MRGEYRALGVDFEERNARFDEAIEVIRGIWSQEDYVYEGSTFEAKGQTANPKPSPQPPIWIGGNSRMSRRRVARYGDGWSPFPAPRVLSNTAKTPPLETVDDLRVMLDELAQFMEEAGRIRRASTSRSARALAAVRAATRSTPRPSCRATPSWRRWA